MGVVILIPDAVGRVSQKHGHIAVRDLRKQLQTIHLVDSVSLRLHNHAPFSAKSSGRVVMIEYSSVSLGK